MNSQGQQADASASPAEVAGAAPRPKRGSPLRYLAVIAGLTGVGLAGLWQGNKAFAPEMYSRSGTDRIAAALTQGKSYALFDLNINIRDIRDAQIAGMKEAPEVAILGASHWQEAHVELIPGRRVYNAHIHRDYWEDPLGMVEMFIRHDKLPRHMIIAIRDNQFTPVAKRKDFLWLPGVPYYRSMAARLKIRTHGTLETLPVQRWKELASVGMLYTNAARWYNAPVKPHATDAASLKDMDLLLPGGSIVWSDEHKAVFTPERTRKLSLAFAAANRKSPPTIDPKGVEAFDALLTFLKSRGVELTFAHPPFNPDYYAAVQDGPYMAGLRKVEELTRKLAAKHGARIIGSFDPAEVGCEASDYIDAEHANAQCLGKLLAQFDSAPPALAGTARPVPAADAAATGQQLASAQHRSELVPQAATLATAVATPAGSTEQAAADKPAIKPPLATKAAAAPQRKRQSSPLVAPAPAASKVKAKAPGKPVAAPAARKASPQKPAARPCKPGVKSGQACTKVAGKRAVVR